jgi:hypothetical protein
VPLRPEAGAPERRSLHDALDSLEQAAADAGVLYADVVVALALALARRLVDVVERVTLGAEPTVAQVHAIRELRIATTELRELVIDHARRG